MSRLVGMSMDRRRNRRIARAVVMLHDAARVLESRWPKTAKRMRELAKAVDPHLKADAALAELSEELRAALKEHPLTKERMASPLPASLDTAKESDR